MIPPHGHVLHSMKFKFELDYSFSIASLKYAVIESSAKPSLAAISAGQAWFDRSCKNHKVRVQVFSRVQRVNKIVQREQGLKFVKVLILNVVIM